MNYASNFTEIDIAVACAGALAVAVVTLFWRQQRLRARFMRINIRLAQERNALELAEQSLVDTRKQVARLSAGQLSLRDADRRRIARDLHDDLGQHLLALGYDIGALAALQPALKQRLSQMDERLRQIKLSMRSIIRDLQPEALEYGLQGALRQQVDQFSRLSGIPCQLEAEPSDFSSESDSDIDATVYRILQESLSNIARHAQASEVQVGLHRQQNTLNLMVRDNGVGLPHPPARRGAGLRGIAQRVAEAGGRFDIDSSPGLGTALKMSFPLR